MTTTYTAYADLAGNAVPSMVRDGAGNIVLTGVDASGNPVEVVGDAGPTQAYRTWLEAGGKLGDPVAVARPRLATTYQLMSALTDAQWAAYPSAKPTDQRLFSARDTPWPEDNAKVGRIAAVIGVKPSAWFDAALG